MNQKTIGLAGVAVIALLLASTFSVAQPVVHPRKVWHVKKTALKQVGVAAPFGSPRASFGSTLGCLGDMNLDGTVNRYDLRLFVDVYGLTREKSPSKFWYYFAVRADFNGDEVIDLSDLAQMLMAVQAGSDC